MDGPGVLAVANQKGGVGKTTTTVNLAAAFANMGERVLVVDLDSSSTATAVLLGMEAAPALTVNDVLTSEDDPAVDVARRAIATSRWPRIDLLPSDGSLAARDQDGADVQQRLGRALRRLDEYDWVLIDAPPHNGRLLGSAVLSADSVLFVTEPAAVSFYGLRHLRTLVETLGRDYQHQVDVAGIVVNKVQTSTVPHRAALATLWDEHGDQIIALIPNRVPIAEALNGGMSLYALAGTGRGRTALMLAEQYAHLAARLVGDPAPPVTLPFDTADDADASADRGDAG